MDAVATTGNIELYQWLVDNVKDITTSAGQMDVAAREGHLDMVRYLHEHSTAGCTTNAMDNAARCDHLDIVKFLHEHRNEGCTTEAMDYAARYGQFEIVRFLHENRNEGATDDAMTLAVMNRHMEIVKFLQQNRTEGCCETAIEYATKHRDLKILRLLHEHYPEHSMNRALYTAAGSGQLDIVQYIVENTTHGCVFYCLQKARESGFVEMEAYLTAIADPSIQKCKFSKHKQEDTKRVCQKLAGRQDIDPPNVLMQAPTMELLPPSTATAIGIHEDIPPAAPSPMGDNKHDGLSRIPLGPVRKNGLELPYSADQLIASTGHIVSAACLYVAAGSLLLHPKIDGAQGLKTLTIAMLSLHIPMVVLLVASWISCERIDPSRPVEETLPNGWLGFKLTGRRWEKPRYCAVCRKAVPGLDHHCTWLQTCVGRSNYAQFFTIACTGTIQFLSQAIYASLCLVWLDLPYAPRSEASDRMQGLLVALLLISVPCTLMYFILLGFHVYLYFLGYGTYEWMLRRRREQRARTAAAAAASAESGSTHSSKRSSTSTLRDTTEFSESRDTRLSSVGSGDFTSADEHSRSDAPSSAPPSRELTAL